MFFWYSEYVHIVPLEAMLETQFRVPNCGDTKGCSNVEYSEYAHLVLFAEMSVRHFTMGHNSMVRSTAAMLGTVSMLT